MHANVQITEAGTEFAHPASRDCLARVLWHSSMSLDSGLPNGEYPESNMKRMTPTLHMSTAGEYSYKKHAQHSHPGQKPNLQSITLANKTTN